jgi:hypothetical protein
LDTFESSIVPWDGTTAAPVEIRWDEKAGLRTGCGVGSQVIDVLKAQIKETGNEEG